jgi:hypothetical protein
VDARLILIPTENGIISRINPQICKKHPLEQTLRLTNRSDAVYKTSLISLEIVVSEAIKGIYLLCVNLFRLQVCLFNLESPVQAATASPNFG